MKKHTRRFALLLATLMLVSVCAACGGTPPAGSTPPPATTPPSTGAPVVVTPPAGDSTALEQLLAMTDKLPLGGLQPDSVDSRAHVNKALPMKKGPGEPLTIGWTSVSLASTYFTELYNSAQAKCDEYGYTLLYQNANFDLNAQMTQIETFLTQNVDVLVVNAVDIDATLRYYEQAVSQGIPVFLLGPTSANEDYPIVTAILSSSFEAGYGLGQYVAEKMYEAGRELKTGFVVNRVSDGFSNSRPCGFISGYLEKNAALNGNPYATKWDATLDGYDAWVALRDQGSAKIEGVMDLVGCVSAGGTDANSGQKVAADLITAHPDMDLIFVESDSLTPGVLQEVEQHGMVAGKDVQICCAADGAKYVLEYIKDGKVLATGNNSPYYAGGGVIDLIHDIQNGYDANDLPANSFTPTSCVSVDDVDKFYDPNAEFAPPDAWKVQTVAEYNAAHAGS